MAKSAINPSALNQLQDQIDAVRREAYADGYAAAMQAVRELVSKAAPSGDGAAAQPQRRQGTGRRGRPPAAATAAPAPRQRLPRAAAKTPTPRAPRGPRLSRGNNARLIEEILQAAGSRALRPAEIRSALQKDKGVAMAFTSIRHALGQLEARNAAEQVGDSKTWRHLGGGAS